MPKTVVIAESNKIMIEALEGILSVFGFSVIGTTSKKSDVTALTRKTRPDLLIFDFNLSENGVPGLSEIKLLKEQFPELKILVMGFQEALDEFAEQIIEAGFDGFFSKFDTHDSLLNKLKTIFP